MIWPVAVAERKARRWMLIGLVVVWMWVLMRIGPKALGYSLLSLIADIEVALLAEPSPVHTRHPYGWSVELSADQLQSAWWIRPHLEWAHHGLFSGFVISVFMWLLCLAYVGRIRSLHDPIFRARIDHFLDTADAAGRRAACVGWRIMRQSARAIRRQLQALWASVTSHVEAALRSPHALTTSHCEPLAPPVASLAIEEIEPSVVPAPTTSSNSETEKENDPASAVEAVSAKPQSDGPESDPQAPATPPRPQPHPSSFYTEF